MMKPGLFINTLLLILSIQFWSCDNSGNTNDNPISTDMIQNPVSASGHADASQLPDITFDKKSHDFNLILEGEVVSYTFHFENTGGQKLIITDISTTCGCTVPTYSKEPIEPGEKGKIQVSFNSDNRNGLQNKKIIVLSNSQPSRDTLEIIANVIVPTEY